MRATAGSPGREREAGERVERDGVGGYARHLAAQRRHGRAPSSAHVRSTRPGTSSRSSGALIVIVRARGRTGGICHADRRGTHNSSPARPSARRLVSPEPPFWGVRWAHGTTAPSAGWDSLGDARTAAHEARAVSARTLAAEPRNGAHAPGAVHVQALEVMSDLLMGVGEGSPPDAFFSRLCEAICRLTAMKRAVLFRYDGARRRVRAVGAFGIELELLRRPVRDDRLGAGGAAGARRGSRARSPRRRRLRRAAGR